MIDQMEKIYRYLDKQGVKHANLGYTYLFEAISYTIVRDKMNQPLMDIYELIAKKYGTNPTNVERAIRYSVAKSNATNKDFIFKASHEIKFLSYIQ